MEEIKKFLSQFSEEVSISLLENNKYTVIENQPMRTNDLIDELEKRDVIEQGSGSREIYLVINDSEYTLQVSDFEFETELSF